MTHTVFSDLRAFARGLVAVVLVAVVVMAYLSLTP